MVENDKLIQSNSKQALQKNIETEIEAGKDLKQASAIAYSIKRENDSNINDGFSGEIKNVSGKVFKGTDGKLYEMPRNSFAIWNSEKQGYYGFQKQNGMPYCPYGGRSALQQILNSGGFISMDGMVIVRPVKDSKSYKLTVGDKSYKLKASNNENVIKAVKKLIELKDSNKLLGEYRKFENGKLQTAQLIKHNNGYTLVASNPKEDKDLSSISEMETYIKSLGFKPVY